MPAPKPRVPWDEWPNISPDDALLIQLARICRSCGVEPDEEEPEAIPDWDDIRGKAPDATGGLPSEEFVRRLRDEWDEEPCEPIPHPELHKPWR